MPMPCTGKSPGQTICNFVFLAILRGSTPLMIHFGVTTLNSVSLVVALKSGISLALFLVSLFVTCVGDVDTQEHVFSNVRNGRLYIKLVILGVMQGAVPYLLAGYGLRYLPPTVLGLFMVSTPWLVVLFERLPCMKIRLRIPGIILLGMLLGYLGIIFFTAPVAKASADACSVYAAAHPAFNSSNSSSQERDKHARTNDPLYDVCLRPAEIAAGVVSMLLASVLWAISSVFWRIQGTKVNHLVASCGQNFFAGLFALLLWTVERSHVVGRSYWSDKWAIIGILFLGIGTGWLATLLVHLLHTKVGARTTNQVLIFVPVIVFIEDCIFVKDIDALRPWLISLEILGLVLVSVGVFLGNFPNGEAERDLGNDLLSEPLLSSEVFSERISSGFARTQRDADSSHYSGLRESVDDSHSEITEEPSTELRDFSDS